MTPEFVESYERNFAASGQYCETREEYFIALNKWLRDVQMWQSAMSYFTHVMSRHPQFVPNSVNGFPGAGAGPGDINALRANFPWFPPPIQQLNGNSESEGLRYRIPPLWKRLVAELLDWVILLMVKLAFTFVLVDFFNIIDLDKYDLNMMQNIPEIQFDMAVDLMSHFLIVELVHRFVVCIAEAYLLREGVGGRIGGATIGKAVVGLRVVLCHKVAAVPGQPQNVVLVTPGTNLGLGWALARSVSKTVVEQKKCRHKVIGTCLLRMLMRRKEACSNGSVATVLSFLLVLSGTKELSREQP